MKFYQPLLKHKFVVFGRDHYNPLGIVRSLGEVGVTPDYVMVGPGVMVPHCRYIKKLYRVDTNLEGLETIKKIYSNEEEKVFILTGSDDTTSLLDLHYDELNEKFILFNVGQQGRLTELMQKRTQILLADECGVKIAKTEIVNVGELPKMVSYPIITKAVDSLGSEWKSIVFICHNDNDLLEAYKKIHSEKIILQEYIKKKNELCIDGIALNRGNEILIPLNSMYVDLLDDTYSYHFFLEQFSNPELKKKIEALFRKSEFEGIFSIEFLITPDDDLYFLEINFRNSGWSYGMTKVGCNLVYLWCKGMLTGSIDHSDYNIQKLPFDCLVEVCDFSKRKSIGAFIKNIKNTDCLFFWNKADNVPFWAYIQSIIYGILKRIPYKLFELSKRVIK